VGFHDGAPNGHCLRSAACLERPPPVAAAAAAAAAACSRALVADRVAAVEAELDTGTPSTMVQIEPVIVDVVLPQIVEHSERAGDGVLVLLPGRLADAGDEAGVDATLRTGAAL